MSDNNFEFGIVLTTVASEAKGRTIAESLLTAKLAACINIFPVQSFYTWQEKIQSDREWQLIIKTRLDLVSQLTATIESLHDYEIPSIIVLPIIEGSPSYLQWIASSTQK